MPSSPAEIEDRARALCAAAGLAPLARVEAAGGGGNSRLYRVTTADGQSAALKSYPKPKGDPRDRLDTEFRALAFLRAQGVSTVPAPLARDDAAGLALHQWIDGQPAPRDARSLEAMAQFDATLMTLRAAPGAEALPLASEACLSPLEALRQVEGRLARLEAIAGEPELARFLERTARPLAEHHAPAARARAEELAEAARALSPSDFGWHNMLWTTDGPIFIDFEYFGWDDPAKLACDVYWHPGMALDEGAGRAFLQGAIARRAATDPTLADRVAASLPLYGLRWIGIVLNEFLPERWEVRLRASGGSAKPEDWRAAKARQLTKAEGLGQRVSVLPIAE